MDAPLPVIAVVDDEPVLRQAMVRLLQANGYGAVPFADGDAFVAAVAAAADRFACVLLDLQMPVRSGFEVIAALDGLPRPPPVIVISGHDDPPAALRRRDLRVFECHRKPVRARPLLAAVGRACAARNACHLGPIGTPGVAP